jgi:hypothetical protein
MSICKYIRRSNRCRDWVNRINCNNLFLYPILAEWSSTHGASIGAGLSIPFLQTCFMEEACTYTREDMFDCIRAFKANCTCHYIIIMTDGLGQ